MTLPKSTSEDDRGGVEEGDERHLECITGDPVLVAMTAVRRSRRRHAASNKGPVGPSQAQRNERYK